jgi:acyl-CoA reductase-like NAD-dependent aldehyde dehydrogenase
MKMLIAGEWIDKKEKIEVENPCSDSVIGTVPDVDKAVTAAEKGYRNNRNLPGHERIRILLGAARIVDGRAEEFAMTITTEGSKAIRELDVGGVIVNDSSDYRIDMMPFGGVKRSGLGREGIKFALQEMTEPRVVCFNL